MSRKTLAVSVVILGSLLSLACGSDHEKTKAGNEPSPVTEAEHGTKFRDASALLEPYKRVGLDGLHGVAWIDYDVDGDLDLFIPGGVGSKSALFKNDEGEFSNVTDDAGLSSTTGFGGVAVGDIDNDGFPDIYASAEGNDFFDAMNPPALFHNNGDGTFTDVIADSGIVATATASGVTMGDINNDGYLDIFLASSAHRREVVPPARYDNDVLYLNNGDMTFTDVTEKAGVTGGHGSCVTTFSDYDNDNWIDLWVGVCNDVDDQPTPFYLYRNNHDGTFTDVATKAGLNKELGYWMALTFADVENDGDLDVFSTNFGPVSPQGAPAPHALFINNGDGTFTSKPDDKLFLNTFAFGATFGDWDNDGWSDLYVIGDQALGGFVGPGLGTPGYLYFNDGTGALQQEDWAAGADLSAKFTSGVAKADFDGDGFLDLVVAASNFDLQDPESGASLLSDDGAPVLLHNQGNGNHWVTVRLRGTTSNRMAIGAKLELATKSLHQLQELHAGEAFLSAESPWPTFGLGAESGGVLKVTWPSGLKEWFRVAADKVVDLVEGSGSSRRLSP